MTRIFKFALVLFFLSLSVGISAVSLNATDLLPARIIDVYANIPAEIIELSQWTLEEKIAEARNMLEGVNLFVGPEEIKYYENRYLIDSTGNRLVDKYGKVKVSKKTISEEAKEIALALLHTQTGKINIIIIKKEGDNLIIPEGYQISITERPSGIVWNYWNTPYKVNFPENLVVIGNRYPKMATVTTPQRIRNKQGKMTTVNKTSKVIEYTYYVPYSDDLHKVEIVDSGRKYIKEVVTQARAQLAERNVISQTVPGKLVTEVEALNPAFFERLPLLEQSDLGEFVLDPVKTTERVLTILGSNRKDAFSKTCNSSSACGLMQFIPSTYKTITQKYPKAQLITDTMAGRADHVNVMMAAILLHDNNLKPLVSKFGTKIMQDPRLEEYLAASYNGSPQWVHMSLNATLGKKANDWTKHLKTETLGFMVKLRAIKQQGLI